MYDERTRLAQQVAEEVRGVFGEIVFETVVPRNVRLAEAPSFGRPIHAYDLRSRGSHAYLQLGREYLGRMEAARAG
jgi:chromosome partitioning protein